MSKNRMAFVITALFVAQCSFASTSVAASKSNYMTCKSCRSVANACLKAGYDKVKNHKSFWLNCMKPVLLGKTVKGVKVDPKMVVACRNYKIAKMKTELNQLERVGK